MSTHVAKNPPWSLAVPPVALLLLVLTWGRDLGLFPVLLVAAGLVGSVVVAVHHAEVVALKVGEPFGTLILAIAVTVIEVALIVTLMVSGGDKTATLARDTVFAAIMITCNGVIGLSLVLGSLRHRVQEFRIEGATGALATVTAMVTLSLVLPTFTSSSPGPTFTGPQLAFAGVASLVLYGVFVFVQTIRHRDYFLPPGTEDEDEHAAAPSRSMALTSLGLLVLCLVAVVGLAKTASPTIEEGVRYLGAPISFVGVVIALLVLAPETVAAVRAARLNRIQTSLNLALGSAMASIGLTIPVIGLATIWLTGPLHLGLGSVEMVLLALTVAITTLTLNQPRGTLLQGAIHLVVFAGFVFLAVSP
jgi:Ca2+:H+ antiporter